MSGLRVPVFFGSLLTLVVLIIQNRSPVFQLTLLGIRSQPFPLGIWVALAVVAGVFLGAVLQRTGTRPNPRPRPSANASNSYAGPAEYQPFGSIPDPDRPSVDTGDDPELDEPVLDSPIADAKTKGWNSEASSSWTAQAEKVEEEGRFWSRPQKSPASKGKVTPIQTKRDQTSRDPVVDAEYRIVQPESSTNRDGFDDDFFDDFFEEEEDG